jgi:LmbE family N-acetylglucosaminyl deacetylase
LWWRTRTTSIRFAATVYRFVRELGGEADQVVITDGEGGYRYSALAESIYGVSLTKESEGRARLPAIRKQETLNAGKILGIRKHYFLDQKDSGFGTDASGATTANWDKPKIVEFLLGLLARERYDVLFTLLPTSETHGHHREATLLALDAVARLPQEARPIALGGDPGRKDARPADYHELAGFPVTQTVQDGPTFVFDRATAFGYHDSLNYEIVVNWVIAEHKSQGLFQSEGQKHDVERFWLFAISGESAANRTKQLARQLCGAPGH